MECRSTICDTCILRLRDAVLFREQVLLCERTLGRLYNKHTVLKGVKEEIIPTDIEEHNNTEHKYCDGTRIDVVKQELDVTFHDMKEDDSLSSTDVEHKYSNVKLEAVDTDDQPLSVLMSQENQVSIPKHYSEDIVMEGSGNFNNINTIMTIHVPRRGCAQPDEFVQTNSPKTAAQRMREYRSRKRLTRQHTVSRPKSAAERMRDYRARKRRKMDAANDLSTKNQNEGDSRAELLCEVCQGTGVPRDNGVLV